MSCSIRVVCFDLGGVLVKLAPGWEAACKLGGLTRLPDFAAWERQHALLMELECGRMAEEHYFQRMGHCDMGITIDELKCVFDAWLQGAYSDAAEMIAELKQRGVKTACLSNTNPRHWRQIIEGPAEYTCMMRQLDYRFASYQIGSAKPEPEIYLHAQQRMNVLPEEILFFDDRLENVQGARALGWNSEQIIAPDAVAEQRSYLRKYGVL